MKMDEGKSEEEGKREKSEEEGKRKIRKKKVLEQKGYLESS